ncbi:MAG: LLM class flavin-dependent oxidoreductase [Actinobacteria bacterium]|nr:LLM class flavin-dependent oxidoreductase [Actinomycetota bacterium]
MTEMWTVGVGLPGMAAKFAVAAEEGGWDGIAIVDSQNLSGDVYVALAMAARETSKLKVAPGVTNPYTRHPAVTAGAIASVHGESGGRAVMGIGRGDSALAHIGLSPASVTFFENYVARVQGYLRGDEVPFQDQAEGAAEAVDALGLSDAPRSSRLSWLNPKLPKVPMQIVATGPKVIGVAARHGDGMNAAVGADPERVAWALDIARKARADAGLQPDGISFGAFVNVVCDPDVDAARQMIRGGLSTFARFSVMHGTPTGPVSEEQRDVLTSVHGAYDMTRHTMTGSAQSQLLTDSFVDRFGVTGDANHCIDRLKQLTALGLERLVIVGPSIGSDPDKARAARDRFQAEVLPALQN